MEKFNKVYKRKKQKADQLNESKILEDFKKVYNKLLESYNVSDFYELSERYQNIFLADLNKYWTEETGLTESGNKFLKRDTNFITENSSSLQKRNYLKKRSKAAINEALKNSGVKYRIYDVIDEMYHQIQASELSEVLSPETITNVIHESFTNSLNDFVKQINIELKESDKAAKKENKQKKVDDSKAKTLQEEVQRMQKKYNKELTESQKRERLKEIKSIIKESDEYQKGLGIKEIDDIAKANLTKEDLSMYKDYRKTLRKYL